MQIDVSREQSKVVILGFRPDVIATEVALRSLAEERREVEDSIKANRHVVISCVIGSGGQTARAFQKELNVGIRVERAEDGSDLDTIILKGHAAKVIAARSHLLGVLKEFYAQTCRVEVPAECLSLIVGKKGARINAMREEFPDASIDIEGTVVYIQVSISLLI